MRKASLPTWLLQKISIFLQQREGVSIENYEDLSSSADNSSRMIVRDVFGFRYEVVVKAIGRINSVG